jgi:HK97 family phage prohead protease
MTTRETRFFSGKIELRALSDAEKKAGYIGALAALIPYESDSRELRDAKNVPFVERLAPGVFARSLADATQPVVADVGHNDAALFARRGVNLELQESPAGLSYTALLPDTTTGRDLKTNIELGILDGTSFEFEIRDPKNGQTIEKRGDGLLLRTIKEAILHRVNPVANPAYLGTSVQVRSLDLVSLAPAALEATPPAPALPPFTLTGARAARFGLR